MSSAETDNNGGRDNGQEGEGLEVHSELFVTSSGWTARKYLEMQVWGIKRNLGWREIYGNHWHTDCI